MLAAVDAENLACHGWGIKEVAHGRDDIGRVRAALQDGYYSIGKAVDANIRQLFETLPKTALRIEPVMTERSDHVDALIAFLELIIAKLKRGTPPEDLAEELLLIWRIVRRKT